MTHKKLAEVFDVEPVKIPLPVVQQSESEDLDADAQYAIENNKRLIETGMQALESLNAVALESEHPRAYEVLAGFMKTLSDMNTQILDIHEKKRKSKPAVEQAQSNTINNTAVFVGTTTELNKLIAQRLNQTT